MQELCAAQRSRTLFCLAQKFRTPRKLFIVGQWTTRLIILLLRILFVYMSRFLAQRVGCFIIELNKQFLFKTPPYSMDTRPKRRINILGAKRTIKDDDHVETIGRNLRKRIKEEPAIREPAKIKKEKEEQKPIKEQFESNPCKIPNQGLEDSDYKCDIPKTCLKIDGTLEIGPEELNLERTLMGGQSFRWTKRDLSNHGGKGDEDEEKSVAIFTGVVDKYIFQLWRLSDQKIAFRTLNKEAQGMEVSEKVAFLKQYFQLKYNLKQLYEEWSSKDSYLAGRCKEYQGFRILRQDPVENVFCFICATNNNIKRISQMVDKLCQRFGKPLEPLDDEDDNKQSMRNNSLHYTFPTVERLADDDVFQCLRFELGFGYRAKYIHETAKKLLITSQGAGMSPRDYLLSLRGLSYPETRKRLIEFQGIGRKVADCICLMSMDHLNSVPTDCHIYEIFRRNYMPCYAKTNLSETMHQKISDYFNELHGPLAGWSTSVLFIAELKNLKTMDGDEISKKKKTIKIKSPL